MSVWLLCAAAALLLSMERIAYILIWRDPSSFKRWSMRQTLAAAHGPVQMLVFLFVGFKVIQIVVFVGWHLVFGDGTLWPYSRDPRVVAAGAVLIGLGQA